MKQLTAIRARLLSPWKFVYRYSSSKPLFPTSPNSSAEDIFQLVPGASPSDIKKRCKHSLGTFPYKIPTLQILSDIELVKLYHPDTTSCKDADVAEAQFHAIHNAYRSLLRQNGAFRDTADDPVDAEAEEIRKRLALWKAAEARRGGSFYDQQRRRRALEAEESVVRWWKSDTFIFYLLGGTVSDRGNVSTKSRTFDPGAKTESPEVPRAAKEFEIGTREQGIGAVTLH
ncbi:hypothetical protein FRC17_009514 [Serendipita sp. 399]|nr:hypothetical protein FRC17_009514 [Serendipita sp. 399]